MTGYHLVVIEIEALTDVPDALGRIAQVLVSDGLIRLDASEQLAPLRSYRVLQRPVEALTMEALRVRRMEEEAIRRRHQLVEERLTYAVMEQRALPLDEDETRYPPAL
jgi:pilus assembly protein TadC